MGHFTCQTVLSLDAAHLASAHKATLYVASVLSGANEVYPIGLMFAAINEDGQPGGIFLHC
jgi:hypothetical protein